MLVLSRNVGQEIVIGGRVCIRVAAVQGKRVRLAIEAPHDVGVRRKELCREQGSVGQQLGERAN